MGWSRWLFIFFVAISLLAGSSWLYRVHLIQNGLPYLLKDILRQAGIEAFQFELNDINMDAASLKRLSFEMTIADNHDVKKTVDVSLHDIELQYDYQALLNGRLDKVLVGKIILVDTPSHALKKMRPVNSRKNQTLATDNKEKNLLLSFKENVNKLRDEWRSLIPMNALTVEDIIFKGDAFAMLDNHQFKFMFYADADNMHVDLRENTNDLYAINIRRQVKDEWLFSIGQVDAASLALTLNDDYFSAEYLFDAEKLKRFLKQNKVDDFDALDLSGVFHGRLKVYYPDNVLPENIEPSLFVMQAKDVALKRDRIEDVQLSGVEIKVNFNYEWLATHKKLLIRENSYINFSQLQYSDIVLKSAPLSLDGSFQVESDKWFYTGGVSLDSLSAMRQTSQETQEIVFKNIMLDMTADKQQLKSSGEFQPAVVPAKIGYKLDYHILDSEGDLRVYTDEPLNLSNAKSFSQLFNPWPYSLDILNGEIAFDAKLKWNKTDALQLITHTEFKNVGGVFDELVFSGLNTKQNVSLLPKIESVNASGKPRVGHTGLIKLDYIDSGVLISDLNFQLALRQPGQDDLPVLDIYNFNAELLGGQFHSRRFTLNFNQPINHVLIDVRHLDLSRVAETQQFSGLEIAGMLDGQLPIEINDEGVFVDNGQLFNADRKGLIRYHPETSVDQLAANPLSAIALKALRDFRYDKLDAQLSYVPEGDLSIGLTMNGISPQLDNGRQVNLNINMEQNLKYLLKSIRFSQGLNDSIDQRVRQKYSATQ